MQHKLIRQISVGALVVAASAAVATSAFAASSNRRPGPRFGAMQGGGLGPFLGGGGLGLRGPAMGLGGPRGLFGPGLGGPGGPRGGAGMLGADVLTPAASYLGVSVSTLESDLKGGKTLAQEATAKGKTADGLIDAIVASEKTVFDAEVSAGWLTSSQETNLLTRVKDALTDLVNNGPAVPPAKAPQSGLLQLASTYLGISVSDLQSALQSGKSLADEVTAAGSGKTVDGLVQALLAPTRTQLDGRVSSGDITQAQETAILNRLTTQLTNIVNKTHASSSTTQSTLKRTIQLTLAHLK